MLNALPYLTCVVICEVVQNFPLVGNLGLLYASQVGLCHTIRCSVLRCECDVTLVEDNSELFRHTGFLVQINAEVFIYCYVVHSSWCSRLQLMYILPGFDPQICPNLFFSKQSCNCEEAPSGHVCTVFVVIFGLLLRKICARVGNIEQWSDWPRCSNRVVLQSFFMLNTSYPLFPPGSTFDVLIQLRKNCF